MTRLFQNLRRTYLPRLRSAQRAANYLQLLEVRYNTTFYKSRDEFDNPNPPSRVTPGIREMRTAGATINEIMTYLSMRWTLSNQRIDHLRQRLRPRRVNPIFHRSFIPRNTLN